MMHKRNRRFVLTYLVPTLLLYAVFCVYPCIKSLVLSLCEWSGYSKNIRFVGFENFARLLSDKNVWDALGHNLYLLIGCTMLTFGLALAFAVFFTSKTDRFHQTLKIIYFIPYVMSTAIVSILWSFIYNSSFGLLNTLLEKLGLSALQHVWLGDKRTIMGALTVPLVWINVGFYMIMFIAAILNIPEERYEAARMDGAGKWGQFVHITLPGIWNEISTSMVFFCVTAFNYSFELVYIMTKGGPNRSSELLTTYLYEQAFKYSDYGYASAIGVLLFAVLAILIFCIMKLMGGRFKDE